MKIEKNLVRFILALIGLVFSMTWFVLLLYQEAPESNRDLISAITGALITVCLKEIYGYFFGSSQSSQDKTDILNESNR